MPEKKFSGGFFSTKELAICALFGALMFFLVFALGSEVIALTGIPFSGGITAMMVAFVVITIGKDIMPRFGSAPLILIIAATLAIPTSSWGPPGLYKVPLLFMIGLSYDITYHLVKHSKWRAIIAGGLTGLVAMPLDYTFLVTLGLPGADKLAPLVTMFTILYAIFGLMGSYLGDWLYEKKIKNRAFVKHLRN